HRGHAILVRAGAPARPAYLTDSPASASGAGLLEMRQGVDRDRDGEQYRDKPDRTEQIRVLVAGHDQLVPRLHPQILQGTPLGNRPPELVSLPQGLAGALELQLFHFRVLRGTARRRIASPPQRRPAPHSTPAGPPL